MQLQQRVFILHSQHYSRGGYVIVYSAPANLHTVKNNSHVLGTIYYILPAVWDIRIFGDPPCLAVTEKSC